ncbi:MAG TPA: TipAS antibiotic-recognition domain-containing protein [Rhodanobacteraceae bacterium]
MSAGDKAAFQHRSEMLGRHFTAEERKQLRERAERFGADNMQRYNQQWQQLIAEVRGAMAAGQQPSAPVVLELARRWYALIQAFSGGDANLGRKMRAAYEAEPQVMRAQGMSDAMFAYVGEAMRAAGLRLAG